MFNRKNLIPLLMIALLGLSLTLLFYVGFYMSDDNAYLAGINRIGIDSQLPYMNSLGGSRWGILFPGALIVGLLGTSQTTFYLIFLHMGLYYVGTAILCFLICRHFTGRFFSLMGAFLVLLNPIFYTTSATLLPDTAMTFYLTLSLFILLKFGDAKSKTSWRYYLLSGICVGIAYACKETAILAGPIFGLYFLLFYRLKNINVGILSAFFIGAIVPLLFEAGLFHVSTGKANLRIFASVQSKESAQAMDLRMTQQGETAKERFKFSFKTLDRQWPGVKYLAALIVFFGILILFLKVDCEHRRWLVLFLLGFVFFYTYLTIGTTSLKSYRPPPIGHVRYLSFLFVFLGGILAIILEVLRKQHSTLKLFSFVSGLGIVCFLVYTLTETVDRSGDLYRSCEVRSFLKASRILKEINPSSSPIYVSAYLDRRLYNVKPYLSQIRWNGVVGENLENLGEDFIFLFQNNNATVTLNLNSFRELVASKYDLEIYSDEPVRSIRNNLAWWRDKLNFSTTSDDYCPESRGTWLGRATLKK